jgi:hypothetical protein
MQTKIHFTPVSSNQKIGPIPATTSTEKFCPVSCPLNRANAGGCYADYGPQAIHWKKVTNGERGASFDALLDNVRKLPRGQLWRHNVSGDLPTEDRVHIDSGKLAQLAAANKGRRGFTYTHHDMTAAGNAEAVRDANAAGFTVNLSANNPAHADKLAELGIAPVVTILPADAPRKLTTPAGRRIVACPAEYTETNCARCGLCARQAADRADIIIGFHVHGTGKKKAAAVAAA